jgi:hypothetical protein
MHYFSVDSHKTSGPEYHLESLMGGHVIFTLKSDICLCQVL